MSNRRDRSEYVRFECARPLLHVARPTPLPLSSLLSTFARVASIAALAALAVRYVL